MIQQLIRSAALVALVTSTATLSLGAAPAKGEPSAAVAAMANSKTFPFRGTVSSTDATAQTVSFSGRASTRTFYVDAGSKLTRDGQPVALSDLHSGDYLKGLVMRDSSGKETLIKATAGEKPETKSSAKRSTRVAKNASGTKTPATGITNQN